MSFFVIDFSFLEFNFETNVLCKKVIPVGIDDAIIGKKKQDTYKHVC